MRFSRRQLMISTATATGLAMLPLRAKRTRRTFVLVPGTWHGGWVWSPVAELLRARGHRCFAVTCTGVGERAHLITPETGLATHVTDVASVIEFEQLDNVILVGHSFGGITITGVADLLGKRVAQLVFYDAFIPTPERPAWVRRDDNGQWPAWWQERKAKFIDGYKMSFFEDYTIRMLVDPDTHPTIAASVAQRLTWHPARQWTDRVSFANGGWQDTPRSYVHCVGQTHRQTSAAMFGPATQPGWNFIESPTQRLGMLTQPALTADLLDSLG
ncbi:MAG: alpha/beta hydrolase [Pseudomonadota bacterium]